MEIAKNIETAANAQKLTLVTDDGYENFLGRTVAKDALGNYYDYVTSEQAFVLRTVDRLVNIILYGGEGNFTVTDVTKTVQRNIQVAANIQGLTLVTDDEYENSRHRTVAKDALGNYYDYNSNNQEFVLRTVEGLTDAIHNGKGNFTVTDITRTVDRNLNIAKTIENAASAQRLTLVTDDEYENFLHRTVAKDALGYYYDYNAENQEFVLRTVDRIRDTILYGGDGNFTVTDITRTVDRNLNIAKTIENAASAQDLTLVTDDEYENFLHRTVAKDALGNYYDYDAKNQEFVLRTVDRIKDVILYGGEGNFTVTDITRTVQRNLEIAANAQNNSENGQIAETSDNNSPITLTGVEIIKKPSDFATWEEYQDYMSGIEHRHFIEHEKHLADGKIAQVEPLTGEPTQEDIIGANDYQRFIDHERDLGKHNNDTAILIDDSSDVRKKPDPIPDELAKSFADFDSKEDYYDYLHSLEYNSFIEKESHLSDGAVAVGNVTGEPTEEDIIGANDYQRFIDHERDLGRNGGGTFLGDSQETGNTSNFKDILDEIYNNRYMDFIEKEKRLHQGVEAVVDLPTVTMGSSKSDKLKGTDEATIFQFDVKSGKGGGSDKVYYSDSADAIVFTVEDETAGDKVADKISTVTKKGKDLVISYNSYKKGKKTVTDKVTVINYFKKSSDEALKDIAIVSKDGEVLDTINLQEQVLKFSGKGKISDTVFNDKITGSKKNDTYTFQNGGNDVVTDKKGKDKYNVLLNEVDKVTINDKKGKDTLILKDVNKSDAVFGFDVVKTEADGELVYTIGNDLFVMSENENSGLVQINNFFKSFTDKDGDGTIDSFKYGSGRVENFKYADGSGFSFNTNCVNEIKSNVAAWLNDHEGYASANEVFANGSKEDVQSLISAYAGNYQA